jgi:hypothetical protein
MFTKIGYTAEVDQRLKELNKGILKAIAMCLRR